MGATTDPQGFAPSSCLFLNSVHREARFVIVDAIVVESLQQQMKGLLLLLTRLNSQSLSAFAVAIIPWYPPASAMLLKLILVRDYCLRLLASSLDAFSFSLQP